MWSPAKKLGDSHRNVPGTGTTNQMQISISDPRIRHTVEKLN